jgi:hypothetical protein
LGSIKGRYEGNQLGAAYRPQLKARTDLSSESLQEISRVVKQLAHRTLVGLPVDFIVREAAHAFED